ncbi:MAG: hypothetical protein HN541_01570 [Euryarchaeota archaeon]|jgi:hypothetical protein|nr:hypothetical protein [Euryarchaeota archaeon]
MRTHMNAVTALILTALMLTSLLAMPQPVPSELLPEEDMSFNEPLLTSARSSSASILTSGVGANNEFGDHIEALPNGGWVVGSEFNSTLSYGTKTLAPTSPYRQNNGLGEFFLGIMDDQGVWSNLVGADHNYGSGGLSFISDITIGMAGEIFVSGYFYGEIAFGPPNPNTLISNTNSGFHLEGFIAKADPTGNWMWAKGFTTLVNGTGENSRTTAMQVDMMGDLFVTGTFQGETDFGGMSLNATSQDIYVAKYDGNQGTLSWVIYGGGIGTDSVFDMAITPSNGVKISTATNGISQWGSNTHIAIGTADAVIVEIDANAAVLGTTAMGTSNQETLVLQIRVSGSGDTYLSGTFGGTLSSGGWTATAAYGGNDIFVAKSATNQANSWAMVSGTSSTDQPQGMAVTSNGGVVFGGFLTATFYAGSKSLSNQNHDGFAVGLSPNGAVDWIERIGGSGYDYVFSMSLNNSDYIGLAGAFTGSMTHKGKQISSGGNYDLYAWVFDPSSLKDTDGDGVLDSAPDNCPTVPNSNQANTDGDSQGDACDSDDDNDGLTDNFPDNCPRGGEFNWTSSRDFNDPASSTDWDNDGCKDDSNEDNDDDNDGVVDGDDTCPRTSFSPPRPTWVSDSATDIDGDGCRDSDEDTDDDGDGFEDAADDCPTVIGTSTLGTEGCLDSDGDMWSDTMDDCPNQAGNSTAGGLNACPDGDGDGWADTIDDLPTDPTVWSDSDDDGYGDNLGSTPADACPDTPGTSTVDRFGCVDADGDGLSTPTEGWGVDSGADAFPSDATQWSDFDEDGFGDNYANGTWFDRPENWVGALISGATDQDACPMQPGASWQNGILGCPDSDGDGWWDVQDAFPGEATQWVDVDGDGYGDNQSGVNPDGCVNIAGNSTIDRLGCTDTDGDGRSDPELSWTVVNGADEFRLESTQWFDTDGDGYGDELTGFEGDSCPNVSGFSESDRFGCPDTDRDGYSDPDGNWTLADGADAYPEDPFTHVFVEPEPVESDEENFFVSPLMLIVYGLVVVILAGTGFMMTRKGDPMVKQIPDVTMHQPMQQQVVMPAAQQNPYIQPIPTQTYAQAAVAPPVAQPDPAREYYNGLIAQGYPSESAASYTAQYFPGFQA